MSTRTLTERLHSGASVLAISAIALVGAAVLQPAFAANTTTQGLFGGGSTLASLALRQVFDCYNGNTIAGIWNTATGVTFTDGYTFAAGALTPNKLPSTCTVSPVAVEELYAGVGSGGGLRGFVANTPDQLFNGSPTLPATLPPYIDINNTGAAAFKSYPYPRIDFGAGDSPLPINITVAAGAAGTYTQASSTVVPTQGWTITAPVASGQVIGSYSPASWGQPIQLPLFEAPVAIAVSLPATGASGWTINSQLSPITAPGAAIQLSSAQICAIFSGLVTDWSSTQSIPVLSATGVAGTEAFDAANTSTSIHIGQQYTGTSTPIHVIYRSDGSGTSYIFTNYLSTVCPLLDPTNAFGYKSIFSTSSLPNVNFPNLVTLINAVSTATPTHTTALWIGESGSGGVAAEVVSTIGNIGYLSNDFVEPQNLTGPLSASVQDDHQRFVGVSHPGDSGTNFIAPTVTAANTAWGDIAAFAVNGTPATNWTYQDYNVYAKVFPATATLQGAVSPTISIGGDSVLPLAPDAGAYPLTGTTFLYLYSCYGNGADGTASTTRVNEIDALLTAYYNTAATTPYNLIMNNNGFNPLASAWATNIVSEYLGSTNAQSITPISAGSTRGCSGVRTGAK